MKRVWLSLLILGLFVFFLPSSNSIAQNDQVWHRTDTGMWAADVYSISIDAQNPDVIYIVNNGTVSKSVNAGATWQRMPVGMTEEYSSPMVIAADPFNSGHVLLGTRNAALYQSLNGGEEWHPLNTGFPYSEDTSIAFDPLTPGTIYVSGIFQGVF